MPGAVPAAPRLWLGAAVLGWLAAAGARRRGKGPRAQGAGRAPPAAGERAAGTGTGAGGCGGAGAGTAPGPASPAGRAEAACRRFHWNRLNFIPAKVGTVLGRAHLRGKPAEGNSRDAGSPTFSSRCSSACWRSTRQCLGTSLPGTSAKPVSV